MSLPGSPAHQVPPGNDWIVRELADLRRKIDRLTTAQTLQAATIGKGGLRSEDFDGTLDPPTVGTQGWALGPDTAILGALLLRSGLIGNDALTDPIEVAIYNGSSPSLTIGTSNSTLHSGTVNVPDGFTQALVFMGATLGFAPTIATSNLFVTPYINGVAGDEIAQCGDTAHLARSVSAIFAQACTGLAGTFTVEAHGKAGSCDAGTGNAHVSAAVLFLR